MTAERLLNALARYQGALSLLAMVGLAVFLAVGFGFKTPATKFADLEAADGRLWARQDSVKARQDSLQSEHRDLVRILRIVALDVCLRRTADETRLMQLPCQELFNPQGPR